MRNLFLDFFEKLLVNFFIFCQILSDTLAKIDANVFFGWYCFFIVLFGSIQSFSCWINSSNFAVRYFFEWKDFFRDYPAKIVWRTFRFSDYRRSKQGELLRNIFINKRRRRRQLFLRSLRDNGRSYHYTPFLSSRLMTGCRWGVRVTDNIHYEPFLFHTYVFKERDDMLQQQRLIEEWYSRSEASMTSEFFYQSYKKNDFHSQRTTVLVGVYKWDKEFMSLSKTPFSHRLEELKKLRDLRGKRYI
jgi:hypothetical protein